LPARLGEERANLWRRVRRVVCVEGDERVDVVRVERAHPGAADGEVVESGHVRLCSRSYRHREALGKEGQDLVAGGDGRLAGFVVSGKLPVKHMPMAPTPGPPHSRCARRASARSHCVTGLDALAAKARNSALTHARWKTAAPSSAPGTAPSRPKSEGM